MLFHSSGLQRDNLVNSGIVLGFPELLEAGINLLAGVSIKSGSQQFFTGLGECGVTDVISSRQADESDYVSNGSRVWHAYLTNAEKLIEEACSRLGLQLVMKASLSAYPGSVHWHYKRFPKERGTPELTLFTPDRRI